MSGTTFSHLEVVRGAGSIGSDALAGSSTEIDMVSLARVVGATGIKGSGHGVVDRARVGVGVELGAEGSGVHDLGMGRSKLSAGKEGDNSAGDCVGEHLDSCWFFFWGGLVDLVIAFLRYAG